MKVLSCCVRAWCCSKRTGVSVLPRIRDVDDESVRPVPEHHRQRHHPLKAPPSHNRSATQPQPQRLELRSPGSGNVQTRAVENAGVGAVEGG